MKNNHLAMDDVQPVDNLDLNRKKNNSNKN